MKIVYPLKNYEISALSEVNPVLINNNFNGIE